MNLKELEILIKEGEGLTVEFKEKYSPRITEDIVGFANSKGGFILLGVNDKGEIVGDKISNSQKAEIVNVARNCNPSLDVKINRIGKVLVISVEEGEEKPYSCSGGYYKRLDGVTQKISQKEIAGMFRTNANALFEKLTNNNAELKDISLVKVNSFLQTAKIDIVAKRNNIMGILNTLKLTEKGKLNNAALLMFAKDVSKFFLQSQIALVLFKDHDKVEFLDRKQLRDDLLTQFNEAMIFLEKHLNRRSKIVGADRIDTYEVPIEAFREAIANAIIHRDYSIQGSDIKIALYPDTLEISNPGGLMKGLTIKELGNTSLRRNEIIADLFHRMHKIEKMGTGIQRIQKAVKAAGLQKPKFKSDFFFTTTFYLPQGPETTGKGPENTQKTHRKHTENAQKIIEAVKINPKITRSQLSIESGMTESSVIHYLRKFQENGTLKRIGPDKGGHWEVVK